MRKCIVPAAAGLALATTGMVSGGTVLWDQIGAANGANVVGMTVPACQYFEAAYSQYDIGEIDDFALNQGYTITSVEAIIGGFSGYDGIGAIQGYQVNIYSSIDAASNSLAGDFVSLNFAGPASSTPIANPQGLADVVQFNTNFFLPAGTWYLSVIPTNNFGVNGQTGILDTDLGDFLMWQSNPGGGFGIPGSPPNTQTEPTNGGYRIEGFIPGPGGLAIIAVAGLIGARRRRR